MTTIVLWIILASTTGLGTGQSIEPGPTTAPADLIILKPASECYINGKWYNPCPLNPPPPPPVDPPPGEDLNQ